MGSVIGSGPLLDLLELGWGSELAAGTLPADLNVEPELLRATAVALGEQAGLRPVSEVAGNWPGCLVIALARVALATADGSLWPAWRRMSGTRTTRQSASQWGQAFLSALGALGMTLPGMPETTPHAAVHAYLAAASAASAAATQVSESAADGKDGAGSGRSAVPGERLRLDPFGRGVLLAAEAVPHAVPGSRTALPEEVADPDDPLLVFDENGEPAGPVLPADIVWALYPAERDLRSDVPPRVIVTGRAPLAWRGWLQVQLDLRGASWLGLDVGRPRTVRGRTAPVLRTGMPIPGVTADGRPVYAAPPGILLPPGPGRWRVAVRRTGSGAVLASVTASGDAWEPEALWRKAPRPLLGELRITATAVPEPAQPPAPAAPGLRRTIVVAESLTVTSHPAQRLTSRAGLEPAEAVIGAPPGMTVSPSALPFPQETATREVACVAGTAVMRLAVTPPHVRLRIDPEPGSGAVPTPWHDAGPLRLTHEDLWRGGALRLDLPGVAVPPPIAVTARGAGQPARPVQVLEPTRQGRYPLRRILDTVTENGDIELVITVGTRTVTIATVTGSGVRAADPWAMA